MDFTGCNLPCHEPRDMRQSGTDRDLLEGRGAAELAREGGQEVLVDDAEHSEEEDDDRTQQQAAPREGAGEREHPSPDDRVRLVHDGGGFFLVGCE